MTDKKQNEAIHFDYEVQGPSLVANQWAMKNGTSGG